ncbi:MAG: hypothetical protein AB1485_09850 [Candidatus Thermoplasmatota archaeon]
MSGHGGSDAGGYSSTHSPCDELNFEASLASPQSEVVSRLRKGDILSVELRSSNGKNFIAALSNNEIAGSIIERVADLVRCIQEGNTYEAEVLSIRGGAVNILVRPA